MNYGLYLSANGIQCSQERMNVLANNLANVNTTAFEPGQVVLAERSREPESMSGMTDGRRLLEQLGGGTKVGYSSVNLKQGAIEQTGIKTDLALMGKGFLQLEGATKGEHTLTRDGRLRFDASGILRHSASDLPVLDVKGRRIQLQSDEQVQFQGFSPSGQVLDGSNPERPLAQLALVNVAGDALKNKGSNVFVTKEKLDQAGDIEVVPKALEGSGADPVTGMVDLIKLTREIEMNSRLIQYQDAMIGQAVTSLGRVV